MAPQSMMQPTFRLSEACIDTFRMRAIGKRFHPVRLDIRRLLQTAENFHTATMTLKNAAFLALIGTLLLTILWAMDFIKIVSGVLNDLVPPRHF
jgi:hypothetical protein